MTDPCSVTLNGTAIYLDEGKSTTLTASVAPSKATNKNLSWKSSNTKIAEVDTSGKVTAVSAGNATITVTTEDGGYTASCKVLVTKVSVKVSGVSLDRSSVTLDEGSSSTLTATVTPSNADDKSVTWKSSDTEVAKVDKNGKVTAVAEGDAIITVTTVRGGYSDSCKVHVNKVVIPVSGITLDRTSLSIDEGNTTNLVASVEPGNADNQNLTWESSDEDVASVDNKGNVTAVAEGDAVITVTTEDGGYTATCDVHVSKKRSVRMTNRKKKRRKIRNQNPKLSR